MVQRVLDKNPHTLSGSEFIVRRGRLRPPQVLDRRRLIIRDFSETTDEEDLKLKAESVSKLPEPKVQILYCGESRLALVTFQQELPGGFEFCLLRQR